MNCRKTAAAWYSVGVRPGAVIVHRLAPPMIEFSGALISSGSYGRNASPQSNLALFTRSPRIPEELKWMPALPDTSNWSGALSRPVYLNAPIFDSASNRSTCFTCALLLISSLASNPSKPSAWLAKGMLCSALYCSNWIQLSQELVIGISAASLALIAIAAFTTSGQVAGGLSGSRPALRNASLLYHIIAVDELNGTEAIRPSARL